MLFQNRERRFFPGSGGEMERYKDVPGQEKDELEFFF